MWLSHLKSITAENNYILFPTFKHFTNNTMNIEVLLLGVIIAVFVIDFMRKGMKKRNDSNKLTKVEDNEEPVK